MEITSIRKTHGMNMIIAMCFAVFIPSFAQYQLSPLAAGLMKDLGISASQFSTLFTAPMIPAVALSLVAGVLVDRFNTKLVLAVAIGITAAGSLLSIFAGSFGELLAAFMLTGVSAAVLNSAQAKLVSGWYPVEKVPQKMGIIMSIATLAMTLALATTALFASRTIAFSFTSILGLLALVLWLILYKNPEKAFTLESQAVQPSLSEGLKAVVQNKAIWVIAFCLFWIMAANVIMALFTPIVLASRGISPVASGYYSSVYMIGCFLSCYLAPAIASRLNSTRTVLVGLSLLGIAGVAVSAVHAPVGIFLGAAILLTGICVGGCIPLLMAMPVGLEGIGPRLAGTAGGFIATIQLLGAIVVPSYLLIPLAGENNFGRLFLLGGISMGICAILAMQLPKGDQRIDPLGPKP